jgi:sugar lactone lactonase YvrE
VAARALTVRVLLRGRGLVESPRWHDGRLLFSDWIAGEIIALDPATGVSEVVVRHTSLPLCFDFLPDGSLVLVSNQEHALLRRGTDGSLAGYADLSTISDQLFNDIVVDGRGNTYVNGAHAEPPRPGAATGLVVLATADGATRVVADDLGFPNGMAVTPDNATLVVAESHRGRLTAFDIRADDIAATRRIWAEVEGSAPDGICIDADGAVWYADVPNRRCVRVADGGAVLDTVELDRGAFACMLGGPDGRTLFVVGAHWHGMQALGHDVDWDGSVFSFDAPAAAAGWPARGSPHTRDP